jgi:ComF family protein
MIKTLLQPVAGLLELAYPLVCQLCSSLIESSNAFCPDCDKQLKHQRQPSCPRCSAYFPTVSPLLKNCPHCQNEDYTFEKIIAYGAYEKILRQIVLLMKNQEQEQLAYHMGRVLAEEFREQFQTMQAVVPVPLHWTRRLWRGYNQSVTLARSLSQTLKLDFHANWLHRRLATPMQATVTPASRRKNLREAMIARLPASAKGQHILLADDIVTTGATADACARALLKSGAGQVTVITLARAVGSQLA